MLIFQNNKLVPIPESDLKENNILERMNLQKSIVDSWTEFRKEIEMPEIYLIGQEVVPHDSVSDRIDILAYDSNDNCLIVFELKKDRDRRQLLQAIPYAAMVSGWNKEDLLRVARAQSSPDLEDLESSFSDDSGHFDVRMVLIAERFDPTVIISADWLHQKYDVDVVAIGLSVFKRGEDVYFDFQQKYPLTELHETYEARSKSRSKSSAPDRTWDEVAETFEYEWGKELLAMCRKEKEGFPSMKRISNFRGGFDGIKWLTVNFKIKFVNIYMGGRMENPEEYFQSKFRDPIEVNEWRDGYSFHITTRSQFEDLCKWLKIKK